MAMNFAQDRSGMDGSFASPAQPRQSFGGKPFSGRGGQPMPVSGPNYLNQAPYGGQGQQSQPMMTGVSTGGALNQFATPQPPQSQPFMFDPMSSGGQGQQSQQMFTGAGTGGGGALGQPNNPITPTSGNSGFQSSSWTPNPQAPLAQQVPQNQQIQNPANAQRVAGMLRGAGRLFGGF